MTQTKPRTIKRVADLNTKRQWLTWEEQTRHGKPTKVPINAVTKPPPPAHSKRRRDTEEAVGRQLHVPNSMSPSDLFR